VHSQLNDGHSWKRLRNDAPFGQQALGRKSPESTVDTSWSPKFKAHVAHLADGASSLREANNRRPNSWETAQTCRAEFPARRPLAVHASGKRPCPECTPLKPLSCSLTADVKKQERGCSNHKR
jgi:hypothetical protein